MTRETQPVPRLTTPDRFAARQWAYFQHANAAKFHWQTTTPFFAATEAELVRCASGPGRLLEVGSGEGGNLFHLGPRRDATVGLDYSANKVAFASCAVPWARFVCADALHLPFGPGAFDRVFCRDLLHHLEADATPSAVAELFRVCRSGGEVILIEPNGRNPLMGGFALVTPAERGMLRSTPARLASLARSLAARVTVEMAQPLPLARVLLHCRFGAPRLGRVGWVRCGLSALDSLLRCVLPRSLWAYVIVSAQAPSAPTESSR
jgi:SAM-dependent methyltransferase